MLTRFGQFLDIRATQSSFEKKRLCSTGPDLSLIVKIELLQPSAVLGGLGGLDPC